MTQPAPGGTARRPGPVPGSGTSSGDPGDEILAKAFIRMWELASGRTLRRDVPPDQLSPGELIAFWADDLTPRAGRHARPGAPARPQGAWIPEQAAGRPARRRKRRRSRGRAPAAGGGLPPASKPRKG